MKPIVVAIVLLAIASLAVALVRSSSAGRLRSRTTAAMAVMSSGSSARPSAGRKYQQEYLARWLRDPAQVRPSAHMPARELTDADVRALAAYLGSLR